MPLRLLKPLLAAGASAALLLLLALLWGSASLSVADMLGAVTAPQSEAGTILWQLRLPRALAAFAAGGLLALSGALLQTLLRNALAEPYLLGVSGGAAVGALALILAGATAAVVHLGAAAGAIATSLLLLVLARREFADPVAQGRTLLLAGVAIAAIAGAVIALMLTLAPETQLRGMLFWLMGDLNGASDWAIALVALAALALIVMPHAHALNALARGDDVAFSLGVDTPRLRMIAFACAALAAAMAVATAGTIGFVGLVAPHLARLLIGNDQRVLLPVATVGGGALLLFADTLARNLAAPMQLPTGAVMALIGAPIFLHLLLRDRHG